MQAIWSCWGPPQYPDPDPNTDNVSLHPASPPPQEGPRLALNALPWPIHVPHRLLHSSCPEHLLWFSLLETPPRFLLRGLSKSLNLVPTLVSRPTLLLTAFSCPCPLLGYHCPTLHTLALQFRTLLPHCPYPGRSHSVWAVPPLYGISDNMALPQRSHLVTCPPRSSGACH